MRTKLTALVGGLVFSVALGLPAAAQAATVPSGPAPTSAVAAASATCGAGLWDYGNGKYAVLNNSNDYVYFEPLSTLGYTPQFCAQYLISNPNLFWITDPSTDNCVWAATDAAGDPILRESGCDSDNPDDVWGDMPTNEEYHSDALYQIENTGFIVDGNPGCLYDDLQEPGTLASCEDSSDHFEWFTWPGQL
jgi:hypothetical protein